MENKELINKIHREYEMLRTLAESKKNEEIKKAYKMSPALEEIDGEINHAGFEIMRNIVKNPQKAVELKNELEKKMESFKKRREEIIAFNGVNPDYDKPVYKCKICSDTGYEGNKRCKCFEEKLIEENLRTSNMGNLIGKEDFKDISYDYYSEKEQDTVREAVKCAKEFCKNFDKVNYNLFFYGLTGLGKTFISAIIAKNVLKKGKSVRYERATKMFSDYGDYKYNDYSLKKKIDELYECDLLVIDDLGSEHTTKADVPFLVDLINERLITNKKTIINTNLEISDFTKNYSVRLTSRIYENFRIFHFVGNDIRIKKLMNEQHN